jgi:hypothetical protein
MKLAIKNFAWVAMLILIFGIMSCGMARQLRWHEAEVTGFYAAAVAGVAGSLPLHFGALNG